MTVVGLLDFLAAMKSVGVCSIKLDTVGIGLAGPSPGRCGILEPQCRVAAAVARCQVEGLARAWEALEPAAHRRAFSKWDSLRAARGGISDDDPPQTHCRLTDSADDPGSSSIADTAKIPSLQSRASAASSCGRHRPALKPWDKKGLQFPPLPRLPKLGHLNQFRLTFEASL